MAATLTLTLTLALALALTMALTASCGTGAGDRAATSLDCGDLAPVTLANGRACLGAAAATCPAGAAERHEAGGLSLCAPPESVVAQEPWLGEALGSHCGPGAGVVSSEDAAGCLFITVTGFRCPSMLPATMSVGAFTACAPTAAQATTLPAALCQAAGPSGALIVSGQDAGCSVGITVTGFDCPAPLAPAFQDASMGICGAPDLEPDALVGLRDAYCGPPGAGQYLTLGGQGGCARWITVTGFRPCPAQHPTARVAAPFSICAADLLSTGQAAAARQAICRGDGALADIGQSSLCTYAITVTGFLCPPLLSAAVSATGAGGAGSLCSRDPAPAPDLIARAASFADAPYVCAWESSVTGAFDQRLAGVGPTPAGTVLTGSVSSLSPIGLPGGEALMTDAPHTIFATSLNVNGTLSDAQIIGRGQTELYTCGAMAVDYGGRWYVAAAGRGPVSLGAGAAARTVDLGDGDTMVARYDALGSLEEAMVVSASDRPDLRTCALAVDPRGRVTLVQSDALSDGQAEVVRFSADGALSWRQPAPVGASLTVAAHPGGTYSLAGRWEGLEELGGRDLRAEGLTDGWVARFDEAGAVVWVAQLNGADEDGITAVMAEGQDLIVTGYISREGRWSAEDQAPLPIANPTPDLNHRDTLLLRLDPAGSARWISRAEAQGNNEGRALSLGLDGESIHLGGVSAGALLFPVAPGGPQTPPQVEIDSRLFFYAGYVASFNLADGVALDAWATSDAEASLDTMWVVGHLDGTTTWAGNAYGLGGYGVDPDNRALIGQEINATIFLVHTPAAACF